MPKSLPKKLETLQCRHFTFVYIAKRNQLNAMRKGLFHSTIDAVEQIIK